MMDLRTDAQIQRADRDKQICARYTAIRKEQPMASKNKALNAIAREFGLVGQTIKVILRKGDCYY